MFLAVAASMALAGFTGAAPAPEPAGDTNGDDEVCEGRNNTVISRGNVGPLRCPVKSIKLLTPEVAAALPDAERP